ncbi:glycosyltransferase [Endozoicomonas lisbonensis]
MSVATLIYDLIPLTHPQFFSEEITRAFEKALLEIIQYSKLLPCISCETQRTLIEFCRSKSILLEKEDCPVVPLAPAILATPCQDYEVDNGLPENYFLIVGTLEPRRGYVEALREFSIYRDGGGEAKLVIAGKSGSNSDEIIHCISSFEQSVLWISDANDSQLANLYQRAIAIISPSLAEGYGMPVAEGLVYNGLVFANRLSVFGEFAGAHPYYFDIEREGELSRLMAGVDQLSRPDYKLNLGSWRHSADAIATQLRKIAPFHGVHTAIELTKVSPEAVRWAHWLVFKRQCNPEDVKIWMHYSTIPAMYDAMLYEVNTHNAI